jgi:hypothetical protein
MSYQKNTWATRTLDGATRRVRTSDRSEGVYNGAFIQHTYSRRVGSVDIRDW